LSDAAGAGACGAPAGTAPSLAKSFFDEGAPDLLVPLREIVLSEASMHHNGKTGPRRVSEPRLEDGANS
jgi:hypothetical protein